MLIFLVQREESHDVDPMILLLEVSELLSYHIQELVHRSRFDRDCQVVQVREELLRLELLVSDVRANPVSLNELDKLTVPPPDPRLLDHLLCCNVLELEVGVDERNVQAEFAVDLPHEGSFIPDTGVLTDDFLRAES